MTISLFLGLSALVCLTDARAATIAENTAGTFDISNNVFGQSFTTSPGSPTSNIAFNFFSDVPATQIRSTFFYENVFIGALTGGNVGSLRSVFSVAFRVTGTPVAAGVPDNGSTVMLLGIGVVATPFASRCRFVVAKSFNARLGL